MYYVYVVAVHAARITRTCPAKIIQPMCAWVVPMNALHWLAAACTTHDMYTAHSTSQECAGGAWGGRKEV